MMLRIGLIGCGHIGTVHSYALAQLHTAGLIDGDLADRLRRAVGFRNIAVHAYERIDWDIVFALSGAPLADFERYATVVAAFVSAPTPAGPPAPPPPPRPARR